MREVPVMLPMVRSTAHKFPLCEASSLDLRNYILIGFEFCFFVVYAFVLEGGWC